LTAGVVGKDHNVTVRYEKEALFRKVGFKEVSASPQITIAVPFRKFRLVLAGAQRICGESWPGIDVHGPAERCYS
jgi:hypothetical protein